MTVFYFVHRQTCTHHSRAYSHCGYLVVHSSDRVGLLGAVQVRVMNLRREQAHIVRVDAHKVICAR